MPRSTKKTVTVKKSNTKTQVKGKKTTPTKAQVMSRTPSVPKQLSAFFNNFRNRSSSNSTSETTPVYRHRYFLPILGLLVLLGLLYLASRYLVVAWVDKKPLTRFEYYNQLGKKYGHDLREQLIVQKLIDSEAQKRHLTASDQEINTEIAKIEQEQGGAQQLDQVLQMQGIGRDELRNLVRLQILRSKMFADQANVSEDEINHYIDQNKTNLPQTDPNDASAEANLKNNVREQLKQQKINASFSAWLQQNLNSDRVIRL